MWVSRSLHWNLFFFWRLPDDNRIWNLKNTDTNQLCIDLWGRLLNYNFPFLKIKYEETFLELNVPCDCVSDCQRQWYPAKSSKSCIGLLTFSKQGKILNSFAAGMIRCVDRFIRLEQREEINTYFFFFPKSCPTPSQTMYNTQVTLYRQIDDKASRLLVWFHIDWK